MKYTITGDNLQFVNVQLEPGEEFQSVSGAMVYMSGNVNMAQKLVDRTGCTIFHFWRFLGDLYTLF